MQIQLKQAEIEQAIRQYISREGINLAGRTVEISFTAGRRESGLSCDVSITENRPLDMFDGIGDVEVTYPDLKVIALEEGVSENTATIKTTSEAEEVKTKSLFG